MLSKRYESTEVDRRTWLHVPSGTHWPTSSDTHQVVESYTIAIFDDIGRVFNGPNIIDITIAKKQFH